MRHIIIGAGAIGGAIAVKMKAAGLDVVAIARGSQLDAIKARGLTLLTPDGETHAQLPAFGSLAEAAPRAGDVLHLAMKTQDALPVLDQIALAGAGHLPIVCVQNGVENERLALRRFPQVYGVCVMMPASFLEPGLIECAATPTPGILDIGRIPSGTGETASAIAADFEQAGFSSRPQKDILRWKYGKLLMNLGNILDAAIGQGPEIAALYLRARSEAEAVYKAAGIAHASAEEDRARRGDLMSMKPIAGKRRPGGSTWQSLSKGAPSLETDYLNGEIALLGRLHGVPVPVNSGLCELARYLLRTKAAPGSMRPADVEAFVVA